MVITRQEFIDYWKVTLHSASSLPIVDEPDGLLWLPEQAEQIRCEWFVCVIPIDWRSIDYWVWCDTVLHGKVKCFASDTIKQQEWWGFTDKDDVMLWILKWSN